MFARINPLPTGRLFSSFLLFFYGMIVLLPFFSVEVQALEYLQFRHLEKERSEEGRVVLEEKGTLIFEARDGQYYLITPRNLISRKTDDFRFVPYTKDEMLEKLKKEFPSSEDKENNEGENGKYNYLDTHDPFIVVYTTSKPFAAWYANLLQKLYKYYVIHWERLGVKLDEPEFPLVAVILANEEQYRQYAEQDGVTLSQECSYYHKFTNRIVMYDMTGQQTFQQGNQRRVSSMDIQRYLRQPGAYQNVMTVIHEAVHQVGYNTNMHPRFSPTPLWLLEGLATLHEVPDPRNNVGWTLGLPHVNRPRLDTLRQYGDIPQGESPVQGIQHMIKEDQLFKRSDTAIKHYALAWGLMYHLVKKRPKELAKYMEMMQKKTIQTEDTGKIRIDNFEACFGTNWNKLHKEFSETMRRL